MEINTVKKELGVSREPVGQQYCDKHEKEYNLYKTMVGVSGGCPDCFKEQIAAEDREMVEKAVKNTKNWQTSYINLFENVSGDLKDAKINNYEASNESQKQAKRTIIDYIKAFDGERSLVLSGEPGLGKSHFGYAITKALRQKGYKTLFIKSTEILDLIKSTYQNGATLTEARIFEVIKTIDCLVVDDLGSEYSKPTLDGHESWTSDILYKIFDGRLNKSTVVTTNYAHQDLVDKYGNNGSRIISRMLDKAERMRLDGDDYRIYNRK